MVTKALRSRAVGHGGSRLGRSLGPARGGQSTGEDDRKSPPEGALQSRQKHSILSLLNLIMKTQRLLEIKRWYAKYERQVSFLCSPALFLLIVPGREMNAIV